MPESIRASGGGPARAIARGCAATAWLAALLSPASAHDDPGSSFADAFATFTNLAQHEYAALALTLGVVVFGVLAAVMLVRVRSDAAAAARAHRHQVTTLQDGLDRAQALVRSEEQVVVMWRASGGTPEIVGDPSILAPYDPFPEVLAFPTWLEARDAQALQYAVDTLRAKGESFTLSLNSSGRQIEAEGRAIAGYAVLRLREVSGVAARLAGLSADHRKLQSEVEVLRQLVERLPAPVWARDQTGQLTFVNSAYARAVESEPSVVVARRLELFDRDAREQLRLDNAGGIPYVRRLPALVAGTRRVMDVLSVPTETGSVAIGIDATEAETMRADLERMIDAHRSTLDHLNTAVAIFDGRRRLIFHNAAYRVLWGLDADFLAQSPTDTEVLETLRAQRKLPEQSDFRQWRRQLHEAYDAHETQQYDWYLPDGRSLRVVTTPNPEGGVTYLYDDVTERFDLVRRLDAMVGVQRETLDNLGEAIAVFGSDGRLRLSNPAFSQMWRLGASALADRPHIETIIAWCRPLTRDNDVWDTLRLSVTALDERIAMSKRIECVDGSVVDCAALPLPDGGTLLTFIDVTASVNVERALVERNDALVQADKLKEDFLQHMSYELRSPLTNIIGFAYFLGDPKTGPLNERQREYLTYITSSTNALLAIVDNILDLATIEAGAMTLDLGPVDIRQTMQAAAEGVQDRLAKDGIKLDLRAASDIGSFVADERRVRQVLFNLLSNAVGFSPPGGTVTLSAERRPDAVVFSVADQGPGIPPEMKDKVFDWFETNPRGSRHRGVGLGLSLVRSFVELHGGKVQIDSTVGQGTSVTCTFPFGRARALNAAE